MSNTPLSPNQVVIALQATGNVIGSATNFMVNVDRRKLPVLALGRVDPLGFGRGFRIISGIIDYVILSKDLLLEIVGDQGDSYTAEVIVSADEFKMQNVIEDALYGNPANDKYEINSQTFHKIRATSLDMLPPLDIIVYGIDETGNQSGMQIVGLEFTSSSLVATVNDVALAQRAEWVARSITPCKVLYFDFAGRIGGIEPPSNQLFTNPLHPRINSY